MSESSFDPATYRRRIIALYQQHTGRTRTYGALTWWADQAAIQDPATVSRQCAGRATPHRSTLELLSRMERASV